MALQAILGAAVAFGRAAVTAGKIAAPVVKKSAQSTIKYIKANYKNLDSKVDKEKIVKQVKTFADKGEKVTKDTVKVLKSNFNKYQDKAKRARAEFKK